MNPDMELDNELFLWINGALSGEVATALFANITRLGNGLILAIIILPSLYFFDRPRFRRHALGMLVAVALSGLVVNLLKVAVDRPRPSEYFADLAQEVHVPLGTPPDRSFPSGHTQTAFGAGVYLSLMYPYASPLFLLMAALVGLSRIALGVHFPLDVLVGAVFGASFSIGGYWIARRQKLGAGRFF